MVADGLDNQGKARSGLVLLIEKDEKYLEQAKIILQETDYRVISTNSAEEGLKIIHDIPIDAIVTSISVREEASDFYKRKKDIDPLIPHIITLFHPKKQNKKVYADIRDVIRDRPFTWVDKPFDSEDLISKVGIAIDKREKDKRNWCIDFRYTLKTYLELKDNHRRHGHQERNLNDRRLRDARNELKKKIVYMHQRIFGPKITRFTEDCIGEVITETNPDMKFSPNEKLRTYMVKRTHQSSDVKRLMKDYKDRKHIFPLPKPYMVFKEKGYFYILSEMFMASDNAKILTRLNQEGDAYKPLINGIVDTILTYRSRWLGEEGSLSLDKKQRKKTLDEYKSNIIKTVKSIRDFTSIDLDEGNQITDELIGFMDKLGTTKIPVFSRAMDCSPSNSGLNTDIINGSLDDILEAVDGFIGEDGKLRYSKDKLIKNFRIWDTPFKPGHFLEDLFHIVDSYEANLTEEEKIRKYNSYLKMVFKDDEEAKKTMWNAFFIVGFYRNFRKMDLVMTKYAGNNEIDHHRMLITDDQHNRLRDDYFDKKVHYCEQAIKYLVGYFHFQGENKLEDKQDFSQHTEQVSQFFTQYFEEPSLLEDLKRKDFFSNPLMTMAMKMREQYCNESMDFERIREARYKELLLIKNGN